LPGSPRIIPRPEHGISRQHISNEALKVLYRLMNKGFKAYLVGGGVRDLYLGKTPKDFDVATDARPSRMKKIFRNCRIIGRRFRIAHIFFPDDSIVEVATFRRGEVHAVQKASGVVLLDNQYGTAEEDARRRDLTINGLFYDPETFSIIDYVGGVNDLNNRIVRTIKPPDASFQEDPVRMIRALRHSARTGFVVEDDTLQGIYRNRVEIQKANPSRLMEEVFRDLRGGAAVPFFRKLVETHLLDAFLPTLATQIQDHGLDHPLFRRLEVLDQWVADKRELNNSVLVSVLLHTVLLPEPGLWTGELPNPPGVWPLLQAGFQEVSAHLRVSRRDFERVVQSLLAFRKLRQFHERGELKASYQNKTYLAEALDFLEIDLTSLGQESPLLGEWRTSFVKEMNSDRRTGFLRHRRTRRRRERGGPRRRSVGGEHSQGPATGTSGVTDAKDAGDAPPRKRRRRRRKKKT
jgi:poly(A) polymerase